MKKCIAVLTAVILMISFQGCNYRKLSDKAENLYKDMKNYEAVVNLCVWSNKGKSEYCIRQIWDREYGYKIEVISPENMSGTTIIYDRKRIVAKSIDAAPTTIEKGECDEINYTFISDFIDKYYQQEELQEIEVNGENQGVLVIPQTGNSKNRFKQNFVINGKNAEPVSLITYNSKGDEVMRVEYLEFKTDIKLEEGAFEIQ